MTANELRQRVLTRAYYLWKNKPGDTLDDPVRDYNLALDYELRANGLLFVRPLPGQRLS